MASREERLTSRARRKWRGEKWKGIKEYGKI